MDSFSETPNTAAGPPRFSPGAHHGVRPRLLYGRRLNAVSKQCEAMLYSQAHALQAIFVDAGEEAGLV
jgi:hypothetical protein